MNLSRRRLAVGILGAVTAVSLTACGGGAGGDDTADQSAGGGDTNDVAASAGIEEVCAAAADEDRLEIWTNWSNPEPIMDGFQEAYPDVDFEHLTILTEDAVPRIITESAAGQPNVDVFYGNISAIAPLIDREMSDTSIDWEALGVRPDLINETQGNIVRVEQTAFGIGYNTDKYSEDEVPDTWDEVIAPEWSGKKLILDPRGRPFPFLATEWGQEEAVSYVKRLIEETDPIILQGTTSGLLAVASGEGEILLNSKTPETEEQKATGAPLGIKLLEPIPIEGSYYGVIEGTEQPNAAKCLTAWTASEEGEQAIFEAEFKRNTMPEEVPADAETFEVDTEEELQTMLSTTEELSSVITGGQG